MSRWRLNDELRGIEYAGPRAHASIAVGRGPVDPRSSRPHAGLNGVLCIRYTTGATAGVQLSTTVIPIVDGHWLRYACYPELGARSPHSGTAIGVDLLFASGRRLSQTPAVDQYGVAAAAEAQGRARMLIPEQWNLRRINLSPFAGEVIVSIELVVSSATAGLDAEPVSGWLDAVEVSVAQPDPDATPADHVRTTRGTHSSLRYSRGGCFPAAAVPRGFNFVTPVTDASAVSWIYSYSAHNGPDNRPRLEAFAISHQPSPHIQDRGTVQFFPTLATGRPDPDRTRRALSFDHEHEVDRPHRYGVNLYGGLRVDIAPTSHALVMRTVFPETHGAIIFDNITDDGHWSYDPDSQTVSGYSDVSGFHTKDSPRLHFWASFDRPVIDADHLVESGRPAVCGFVRLDLGDDRTVSMTVGTSYVSVDQARLNAVREIGIDDVDTIAERAKQLWNAELGAVEVEGASPEELITVFSNLYRLFLYPNDQSELLSDGRRVSAIGQDPVQFVDERLYVNNGFWDTYRTTWPMYALLRPRLAGELIDGFVGHYRARGWIPRWSAPGPADIMVGTSSDIIIADALAKGVSDFDVESAYDASVKNATVIPTSSHVGRKGMPRSMFCGFTPATVTEGLSWTLEGAINDFGLAVQSEWLIAHLPGHPRTDEWRTNARYFWDRACAHRALFDHDMGFFRGRLEDGSWRQDADLFDPLVFGYDYTETNAWNMAFSAPHDLPWLLQAHGGRDGLADKLDEFFSTPETGEEGRRGSYAEVVHVMTEGRDIRHGLLGLSNQPSHHIPYVWMLAGQPHRTQQIVRDCLRRLFVGSDCGQGYLGDEDNGEMSAWYLFGALGLYPLEVGTTRYLITSPLFAVMRLRFEDGNTFTVRTVDGAGGNDYIQGVTLDGVILERCYLEHEEIVKGGELVVHLGPEPTAWGSRSEDMWLESGSHELGQDITASAMKISGASSHVEALCDGVATTAVLIGSGAAVEFEFPGTVAPTYYTLSIRMRDSAPRAWALESSVDGDIWSPLDERPDESFAWDNQTRPFLIESSADAGNHVRLVNRGAAPMELTQVRFIANEPATPASMQ